LPKLSSETLDTSLPDLIKFEIVSDEILKQALSDIRIKIRGLFAEFDRGDIFYSDLKRYYEFDRIRMVGFERETLEKSKHILLSFINHLNEFRK
jgi:hypothetical protein